MKRSAIAGWVALALAAAAGCHRIDERTAVIRVPGLNTDADAERLIPALDVYRDFGMVLDVLPNVPDRTVTIVYDSRTVALKNLEYLIARAGFDANDTPALPPPPAEPARETP